MIRLKKLEMQNVKNVVHGAIDFQTNGAGGSVTGIYGQNGSGKTAVIDILECLREIMAGMRLAPNSADYIRYGAPDMTVTALFEIDGTLVQYDATFIKGGEDNRLRIKGETMRIGDDPAKMGRPVFAHELDGDPDKPGRKKFKLTPAYIWNDILRNDQSILLDVAYAETQTFDPSMSYVFYRDHLQGIADRYKETEESNAKTEEYVDHRLEPLAKAVDRLTHFALHDMFVAQTSRTAPASFNYIILPNAAGMPDDERMYDLLGDNMVGLQAFSSLKESLKTFNEVLPRLVPGLNIEARDKGSAKLADGSEGVKVEFLSVRDDSIRIPFRCESEGIVRLTSLLSHLIHSYNEPDAFTAIDELDSGVFEYLLGQIAAVMSERAHGQLVFTAHNLRTLETMPNSSIVVTTVNPGERFAVRRNIREVHNPRSRYISNLTSDGDQILYRMTDEQSIATGMYRAGHPGQDNGDVDRALRALIGGE